MRDPSYHLEARVTLHPFRCSSLHVLSSLEIWNQRHNSLRDGRCSNPSGSLLISLQPPPGHESFRWESLGIAPTSMLHSSVENVSSINCCSRGNPWAEQDMVRPSYPRNSSTTRQGNFSRTGIGSCLMTSASRRSFRKFCGKSWLSGSLSITSNRWRWTSTR